MYTSTNHADIAIINGKIITADKNFSVANAIALKGDRIAAVGTEEEIKKLVSGNTKVIDAKGMTVIPGLIEAHLHPEMASLSELEEEIPDVHTIGELLQWVGQQAKIKSKGEWIIFQKFFYTRLQELRMPSKEELDKAAPSNPVFLNGTYGGVVNSVALKKSGITKDTRHEGVMKDHRTGLPTGVIRKSAFELLAIPKETTYSEEQKAEALVQMLNRYNRYGITGVCSGEGDWEIFKMYNELHNQGKLTARAFVNIRLPFVQQQSFKEMADSICTFKKKTGDGNEWVKTGPLKILLDGGILTGTAYLRQPWGKRAEKIFGFDNPDYKGVVNYSYDELLQIVSIAAKLGWKFTAHSTGGGGVDLLLDVYEEVNKSYPLKGRRFSIIHGNFFTPESMERMKKMDIYADMQAAWFYKDADAMKYILGDERIKYFLPFRSLLDKGIMVNGGSDHMVKFDAHSSINPYNPFLGMWSMITRKTERGSVIMPEEAVTREEALKMYTINNAYASFEESLKGSVEPGKVADLAILSDDILTCNVDQIKHIKSELTMVGGKIVYSSGKIEY